VTAEASWTGPVLTMLQPLLLLLLVLVLMPEAEEPAALPELPELLATPLLAMLSPPEFVAKLPAAAAPVDDAAPEPPPPQAPSISTLAAAAARRMAGSMPAKLPKCFKMGACLLEAQSWIALARLMFPFGNLTAIIS
jgi:hypothetical protein